MYLLQVILIRRTFVLALSSLVLLISGCSSSLEVALKGKDTPTTDDAIPFYLPRHDFIVSDLALDANGNEVPAGNRGIQISLVTRRDEERAFLVKNNVGLFTASDFSVTRDVNGRVTEVTGSGDDKSLDAVKALASFYVSADGFAAGLTPAVQGLIDERTKLKTAEGNLLNILENSTDAEEILHAQTALSGIQTRLGAIRGALAGAAGTQAFGTHQAKVMVCKDRQGVTDKVGELTNDIGTNAASELLGTYVFLVATEGDPANDSGCRLL